MSFPMGWLDKLRGKSGGKRHKWAPPQPEEPVYVVGDIHGMNTALERLLDAIDTDIGDREVAGPKLVFVGDYIDRGDYSATVLKRMAELSQAMPDNVICLMGNHEKMMLEFLDAPRKKGRRWIRNGGLQTIASFGVRGLVTDNAEDEVLAELSATFRSALPEGLEDWLRTLPQSWTSGNLAVVHASANPKKTIAEQSERSLLWGNNTFFEVERSDGIWVAHGHTVVETAKAEAGRISVDTGAVFGGVLTAAALDPSGEVRFLQV